MEMARYCDRSAHDFDIGDRFTADWSARACRTSDARSVFRWRSPEPIDNRIVIIGIDEADVRQYAWPVDDALLTKLLDKVRQQQPRAIGLDLARDKPVGVGYSQLEKLFKTTPNLIGATKKLI